MKKVICAMSGGVDSSVAAALLKRAGFDVIGIFMKFWKPRINADSGADLRGYNRCCSPEAEIRARKVAKILKIPFYVFDFSKEFKERIVDYFLEGYKKGITPNPCVVCNKEIKFGLLLEKALKLGADFVATGHYARKEIRENSCSNSCRFAILRAKDKEKDQSYFLWMLNQKQLKRILFPIGDLTRNEVENLARKFRLPVLRARKSVEICFIQTTINDFLKKYLKEKPGKIIDTQGKILGEHKGLWFYTIGQRKGILLSSGPYFVLDKDLKKNVLIVTKNERDLYKKELVCKNVNWISGKEPKLPLKIKIKIRYRTEFTKATIHSTFSHLRKCANVKNKVYKVVFENLQRAITPGQSVVFYKGDEVLGGGVIFQ
jgi:tRNA-specific 2-thiouridylase